MTIESNDFADGESNQATGYREMNSGKVSIWNRNLDLVNHNRRKTKLVKRTRH